MGKIRTSLNLFKTNRNVFWARLVQNYGSCLSDKAYIQLLFKYTMGYKLDLSNPRTYNEKLQWLKLYDRRNAYVSMVDKYAVKEFVKRTIGEQYVIPTIGEWNTPEQIEWEKLPEQFVLKTTMGGGSTGVLICKDKKTLDIERAKKNLSKSLTQDLYRSLREWPYKNVPKKIIAEPYMEDAETKELADYKFFCFDGVVKALFIGTERGTGDVKFDYYDENFNHLDLIQQHPMSGKEIRKPFNFELMKELASKLSSGIPHVRVDFYECNGRVYFGELTFYHHGGLVPFHPAKWDEVFGSWITLPEKTAP